MEKYEEAFEAAVSRARQALEKGVGLEVNTRMRLCAMLQCLFDRNKQLWEQVRQLRAELDGIRAAG